MGPLRILRIAAGGDGVGRLDDGRTVFVPRTAPGDLAELTDVRPAKRFARARLGRLLEPSPDRVEPPCPHYGRDECGGCQLQHLAYPAQLEARRSIAGEALRRLARLDVADPPIEPAEQTLGYRTKLTLAVFDLDWCHITAAPLNQLWQVAGRARALLPARLEQIVLRIDRGGRAGDEAPAGVFEQVHPRMGDRVRAFAIEPLGPTAGRTVWDLYAGVGDTTAALARGGARIESVEIDRWAVAYAERTGPPATRHVGAVEAMAGKLRQPDLVVTNPPRTGMDARVPPVLRQRRPARIVYVSCDPATLARDIGRLGPSYRLLEARCFDLFPQTAHLETVAVLERA